jgi:hypothetical protein
MPQYQVRILQIPRWLALVVGALAVAFAIALFLLSLTVFLLVLPVVAVAGALYYLFGLPRTGRTARGADRVEVIEGEYRVIEQDRVENGRKRP